MEPYAIATTTDPHKLVFTCRLSGEHGLWTIQVTNDDPKAFAADVINVSVGNRIEKGFDLDIQNASGVAVLPDLSYAFVADWQIPSFVTANPNQQKRGAKIGIVKEPFGKNPKLVASTTPIPQGAADSVILSPGGNGSLRVVQGRERYPCL